MHISKARKIGLITQWISSLKIVGFVLVLLCPGVSRSAFQEGLWGARPSALAGAYTAIADDANAPAYNPAGISLIPDNEITIMYARLYEGLDLYVAEEQSKLGLGYFSYVPQIKNKKYGSYAFSWSNFNASKLLREDTFSLTWADSYQFEKMKNSPVLSYGANLKMLRRSFSTDSRTDADPVFSGGRDANGLAGDVGLLFMPYFEKLSGLRFGAVAQNFNEPDLGLKSSDKVPARYALGVAYSEKSLGWFNPSIDFSKRGRRKIITAGWEARVAKDTLALRAGANEDQLTGGMGYKFSLFRGFVFKLDYAILWPLNIDGTNGSHRVSFTTNF